MIRYRLDYRKLFLVIMISFFVACENNDDIIEYESVKTIVKGNVSDIQRNFNISDFEIKLIRSSVFVTLGGSGINSEEVARTFTDSSGNYEIEFDYIKDEKFYGFEKVYYGMPYHTNFIEEYDSIISGETNVRNIDAWKPVKIKLNLHVQNNNNPPLLVDNKIVETGYSSFPQASIHENDTNAVVYLDSKPNSAVELNFHYTTGNSNGDYHSKTEMINTTLQDTISFSYLIDCSTF